MAVTARPPGTVVGDRGFGTAANDQALAELAVARVGLARTAPQQGPSGLGTDPTVQAHAQLAGRDRARISQLKRSFGLRRTRLRRLGGARTWVGLGIFAYNLQRMTVVTAG
jgi:IS5 family transposase